MGEHAWGPGDRCGQPVGRGGWRVTRFGARGPDAVRVYCSAACYHAGERALEDAPDAPVE